MPFIKSSDIHIRSTSELGHSMRIQFQWTNRCTEVVIEYCKFLTLGITTDNIDHHWPKFEPALPHNNHGFFMSYIIV